MQINTSLECMRCSDSNVDILKNWNLDYKVLWSDDCVLIFIAILYISIMCAKNVFKTSSNWKKKLKAYKNCFDILSMTKQCCFSWCECVYSVLLLLLLFCKAKIATGEKAIKIKNIQTDQFTIFLIFFSYLADR